MMMLVLTFVLALLLTLWLASDKTPLVMMVDKPNERSLHEKPTPHSGGIGIIAAIVMAWLLLAYQYQWPVVMSWIAAAALLVAMISLADDIKELSPLLRIIFHAAAAVILIAGHLSLAGLPGIVLTGLAIIWMLNLYNFMDGMDGFAGGMTLFGFGFLGCAGWMQGDMLYALYAWSIMAAAAGFLIVNFPPARIFMGDIGSATLGLLAAAFSLWGIKAGLFHLWFPLLLFSSFVVDATVTLIRRISKRERVWEAHRSHYYQRLVQMGWGHKKTVLAEYACMMMAGISALIALKLDDTAVTIVLLAGWVMIYFIVAVRVHQLDSGGVV